MASVQAPQTVPANYIPHVVQHYLDTVWPGWNPKLLLNGFAVRFDLVRYHRQRSAKNYVYSMVSSSDEFHVHDYYGLFKSIYGVVGDSGSPVQERSFLSSTKAPSGPWNRDKVQRKASNDVTEAYSAEHLVPQCYEGIAEVVRPWKAVVASHAYTDWMSVPVAQESTTPMGRWIVHVFFRSGPACAAHRTGGDAAVAAAASRGDRSEKRDSTLI